MSLRTKGTRLLHSRLEALRRRLADQELDAILISQAENRRYLSGFHGSAGYLLIDPLEAVLATDFRYTEQAATQAPEYRVCRIAGALADWLPELVAGVDGGKLGFESEDVSFALHGRISEAIAGAGKSIELVPVAGIVESLRAHKDADEIASIEKAAGIADAAFERVTGNLRAGTTEKAVAWDLEKALRDLGSETIPFEIIVAAGANAALPHHRPSDHAIGEGEPIVIDMGATSGGYGSDLSRTLCLGTPDDTFREVYSTVLAAQQTAIDGIEAGITGQAADALAREVIEKAGHGAAFGHSLGHGVGMVTHEAPTLGPNADGVLEDGAVFSIEPGIYLSGWGGVRIEDLAVMEKGRPRLLSKAAKLDISGGKDKA